MKKFILLFGLFITCCSCGSSGSSAAYIQPKADPTNFAGTWRAEDPFFRADLQLATTDNVQYSGSLSLTSKATLSTLTSSVTGSMSWGFGQGICAWGTSRTWMVMQMSNIQGSLYSPNDSFSSGDGTLWFNGTNNFDRMNITWGLETPYGSDCINVSQVGFVRM